MFEIKTQITINAPAHRVWDILMDFKSYPGWNPFVRSIKGSAATGNTLEVELDQGGGNIMKFRPKILDYENMKELRWLGVLFFPGLFDGEHSLKLQEVNPNETIFTQEERFTGILVPLLKNMLANRTKPAFEAMNLALKKHVEGS